MGSFIDKVKASVKSGAEQAATKAQVEFDRLSVRRELASAYEALGTKTFELAEKGAVSHPELSDLVQRVRELQTQLAAIGTESTPEPTPDSTPEPAPEPAAGQEPPPAS